MPKCRIVHFIEAASAGILIVQLEFAKYSQKISESFVDDELFLIER